MNKKNLLIGGGIVVIVVAAFLLFSGTGLFSDGKVVASVNGEEIMKSQVDLQVKQIEQSLAVSGQSQQLENEDFQRQIRERALDQVIGRALLIQEAKNQGVSASSSEVENRYQEVVSQAGGEEALNKRFQETGISEDQLRADLRDQVLIENYVDMRREEAPDKLTVTEEEVLSRYEELKSQSEAEAPPLSDVREQIRLQLEREKENQFINDLISQLRSEAEVDILN